MLATFRDQMTPIWISQPNSEYARMQNGPLKIALIGLGHVAKHQIEALSLSPSWNLVGAADIQPERALMLPPDIPFFPSAEALLDETCAEVCVVATGLATHFEIGKQVLENGRHLILEKPCCSTLGQLRKLADFAQEKNRQIIAALHAAHALDLLWFTERRDQLDLGMPTSFRCRFFDPYIENNSLCTAGRALGGSWLDSGINALSVLATVVPASSLSIDDACFSNISIDGCIDIQANIDIRHEGFGRSCLGTVETHWGLGRDSKTTLLRYGQTDTEILLDHSKERISIYRSGRLSDTIDLQNGRPRLVNHYAGVFVDAYQKIVRNESNIGFALPIHQLLFAALSMREHQRSTR